MFTKELASKLIKIINERNMTVESLAEAAHLSRRYVGNVISQKQVPSLYSFEKLCTALQLNPDELLLSDKSKSDEKSQTMQVRQILYKKSANNAECIPLCPDCNHPLGKEYQAFCDRCGRKLGWSKYSYADKIEISDIISFK